MTDVFNSTKEIIFLKHGKELQDSIVSSITICKYITTQAFGKTAMTAEEGGNNDFPTATIIRYFDNHTSLENRQKFDENWVNAVLNYAISSTDKPHALYEVCTDEARSYGLGRNRITALRSDFQRILHFLWVDKAVLLPTSLELPRSTGKIGEYFYQPESNAWPEVLAIFKDLDPKYPLEKLVGAKGVKNTIWYAYRLIRATKWYEAKDISNDAITKAAIHSQKSKHPFTLRQWLYGLQEFHPNTSYDIDKSLNLGAIGGRTGSENGSYDHVFERDIPDSDRGTLKEWLHYIDEYCFALKKKGQKNWQGKHKVLRILVGWLISERLDKKLSVYSIRDFDRRIMLDEQSNVGLLTFLKGDNKVSSYKSQLYVFDSFFGYLESYRDLNFRNPLNAVVDFPIEGRKKQTVKKIFPSDAYAPLLSFCNAIAEFAWYEFSKLKDYPNYKTHWCNNSKVIDTERSGCVPIYYLNGKPKPIFFIPTQLVAQSFREFKECGTRKSVPDIHFCNLLSVLLETGIRLMHLRWLDVDTYRSSVSQSTFKERDYGVNFLHVNTDKSHGPWTCHCSNTVIEMLDRQAVHRSSFVEDAMEESYWYDGHEESPFGKIKPLFRIGGLARWRNSSLSADSHLLPISDGTFRNKFKQFIHLFTAHYLHHTGEELINDLVEENTDVNSKDDLLSLIRSHRNLRHLIDYTPHSIRSQVVSENITLLPPSEIMKITGHASEAHCVYYAQLEKTVLDKAKEKQFSEIIRDLGDPVAIKADDNNSKLRQSFERDRSATIADFGATSFHNFAKDDKSSRIDALDLVRKNPLDEIAFANTHICPFNFQCPEEVVKDLNATDQGKPCGACYYSVKVVDHLPAILAKIRAYTDESDELQNHIKHAKLEGASRESLSRYAARRKFLTNEIVAWTITVQCLEQMAGDLSQKDQWLIQKPELLSQKIERIEVIDNDLQSLYLKASEARTQSEFFTPALQHQITKARTLLLAKTGDFKALLEETPNDFTLIDQFRGHIKTICSHLNIGLSDLAMELDKPLSISEASNSPVRLIESIGGITDA